MRFLGKLVLPLLVLGLALGGAGYLRATRPLVEPAPLVEKVWDVRATEVRFTSHQPSLELFGEVVATRDISLEAAVAGRVIEIADALVDGGRVTAGALLVRLDPFTYDARLRDLEAERRQVAASVAELEIGRTAQADLLELGRERLAIARRDVERYERLGGRNVTSEQQLDAARNRASTEATVVRQAEREIASLGLQIERQQAALERLDIAAQRARRDLADTELRAPSDALVDQVTVAVGKEVRAFEPLARLIDLDGLEIRFPLRDAEFGRLWTAGLIGRELTAVWRLGDVAFPLTGEVSRIQSRIDASRAGVDVYARITANPLGAPLRPGAFLHVQLPDRRHDDVAALPATALFADGTVFAVDDGRLVPHRVEVLDRSDGVILVRGGLAEGEAVVTSRLAEIKAGLKVEVIE